MIPHEIKNSLHLLLSRLTKSSLGELRFSPLSGGSINETFKVESADYIWFVKFNVAESLPGMFEKEAKGLNLLQKAGEINVPDVLHAGVTDHYAFLLLSWIAQGPEKKDFWEDFGMKLAALHSHKAEKFGLDHDNYIGSLHQYNQFHDNWTTFFIEERLERQVRLARETGKIGQKEIRAFERLYRRLDEIFPPVRPSLLHGDLWSGNFMVNRFGEASLIDPAVYYGHPEIDIAMTTLFGGFSSRFYEAYCAFNKLEKNWQQRLNYYNLYPLMVHVNLFGGGYLGSVYRILEKFD
ncbi:MAG TPA: fructosamine kinase family protein [Bacteroidales bacterium]|nr:fructosamine kinase family protein [Bacteroidales bacterium]